MLYGWPLLPSPAARPARRPAAALRMRADQPRLEAAAAPLMHKQLMWAGARRAQGAFMAALFAQGLSWEAMHALVRRYAAAMGSARHLLADLTLPLISVFSGAGFDRIVRDTFATGAQRIEDLWLRRGPAPPPPPCWAQSRASGASDQAASARLRD